MVGFCFSLNIRMAGVVLLAYLGWRWSFLGLFSVIPLIPEHVVHSPSSCTGPFGGFSLCIHATALMFQSTQTKAQSRCKFLSPVYLSY